AAALRAFRSQFHNPQYPGEATWIASEAFWEAMATRAAYWGARIGARYGEPFFGDGPPGLDLFPGLT
ncbi:MAG TPA: bacillithiol biosynthesis deacetylase BshB1, partial [Candidatus Hydrogenedentes bacterium]|nr:bacillithiol biosynthesis deacetylase BshB1 [Candidatus Hydrogenedentota bacterium]